LCAVPIDQIKEIRIGKNTETLRAIDTQGVFNDLQVTGCACVCARTLTQDECAFSVIYGDFCECLDLIANSPEEANIWVTGLMALTAGVHKRRWSKLMCVCSSILSVYSDDCLASSSRGLHVSSLRER
jgi:hypothetical protein